MLLMWKKMHWSRVMVILFIYTLCGTCNDLILSLFHLPTKQGRRFTNIFSCIEFFSFLYIYFIIWKKNKTYKTVFRLLLLSFLLVFVYSVTFLGLFSKSNHVVNTFMCITFSFLSVLYFFQLLDNFEMPRLSDNYLLWLNTAIMIFFFGTLFLSIFRNQIMDKNSSEVIHNLWNLYNVFNISFNILLGITVYKWIRMHKLSL